MVHLGVSYTHTRTQKVLHHLLMPGVIVRCNFQVDKDVQMSLVMLADNVEWMGSPGTSAHRKGVVMIIQDKLHTLSATTQVLIIQNRY